MTAIRMALPTLRLTFSMMPWGWIDSLRISMTFSPRDLTAVFLLDGSPRPRAVADGIQVHAVDIDACGRLNNVGVVASGE